MSSSGIYSLQINKNSCLLSSNNLSITIKANPAKPTITALSKSLLQSSVANSYQWYLNNSIISSATNQTLAITTNGNYSVKIDSTNGCGNLSNPFPASSVGVNEVFANDKIKVFPNPVSNSFYLENSVSTTTIVEIKIYDVSGKIILSKHQNISDEIDVSGLDGGMYFVVVGQDDKTFYSKFIKY